MDIFDKRFEEIFCKKKKFEFYILLIYIILGVLFGISLISETFCKESIAAHCGCGLEMPKFLQANAIYEVISFVGFSNIFIVWIYINSEKRIFGLTYSKIIKDIFSHHNKFSIIHIASTLMCIAFSSAGLSEGSLICLSIVFVGFIYQFYILFNIFKSETCLKLACGIWSKKLKDNENRKENIIKLLESFPEKNVTEYKQYCEFISKGLYLEANQVNTPENLKWISDAWNKLCNNSNVIHNECILEDMFINIFKLNVEENEKKSCACKLITGYIASYTYFVNTRSNEKLVEDRVINLIKRMKLLIHNIFEKFEDNERTVCKYFYNCIFTNIYILQWLLFQHGMLKLSLELLENIPKEIVDIYAENMGKVIFFPVLSDTSEFPRRFSIALNQLTIACKTSNDE